MNLNSLLVELFIAKGADVNAPDSMGFTALDIANYYQKQDIIMMLEEAGAEEGTPAYSYDYVDYSGSGSGDYYY